MSDFTPIATGLSAVKTGFDLIKTLREVLKQDQVDHEEISNRLMEIQQLLLDAQEQLRKADDYCRDLDREVEELRRLWDFGKTLEPKHGVWWKDKYPYCPSCWEADRKPIRLGGPEPGRYRASDNNWTCPIHKATYVVPLKGFDAAPQL